MKCPLLAFSLVALAMACTAGSKRDDSDAACVGPSCANADENKEDFEIGIGDGGSGGEAGGGTTAGEKAANGCGIVDPECEPEDLDACVDADVVPSNGSSESADAETSWSCQVASASVLGGVSAVCEVAGTGVAGDPCVSAADCTQGYACIEQSGTAQCRLYCCADAESCPGGTYCASRVKKELVASRVPLSVMACIPSESCRFDEPYPCDASANVCSCGEGRACGLVRSDGTTACVVPGEGLAGDACPCAAHHVCSEATQTCLQVCRLGETGGCGDEGTCQASTNLGREWGVCVTPISVAH